MSRSKETWRPVERLRRIWTPDREIYELADKLEPGSQLDSIVRELFSRTIQRVGSIQLDMSHPITGFVRWEEVRAGPGKVVSVWWQPEPDVREE